MLSRPRDPNQLAKLIVDIASGEVADMVSETKRTTQPKRGRAGGLKGGTARAKQLSAEERTQIATAAAHKRWAKA